MNRCSRIHWALDVEINKLLKQYAAGGGTLLDVGCWDGATTLSYGQSAGSTQLMGIEGMKEPAEQARQNGLEVIEVNLETEEWGLPEASIDVMVCNQVFEHLKNIFIPFDQMCRVLKPGGFLFISVPNLAAFHSRIMLLLGMQPSSLRIWGPHVRGYALREFTNFCLTMDLFEVVNITGVGFYPLIPEYGGNLLANIWKNACHTPIWVLRRTSRPSQSFHELYLSAGLQTMI